MVCDPSLFSITVEDGNDGTVVCLRGELDLAGAPDADKTLAGVGGCTVIADLDGLRFVDAAGIDALMRARKSIGERGGRLVVRNARGAVRRTLQLAEVVDVLLAGPDTTLG